MKKIPIKAVIAEIETYFVNKEIKKFSIVFAKIDEKEIGKICDKRLCSRVNPFSATDFKKIAEKNGNGKLKKAYNVFEKRLLRIFDLQNNKHCTVNIDTIIIYNNMIVVHGDEGTFDEQ